MFPNFFFLKLFRIKKTQNKKTIPAEKKSLYPGDIKESLNQKNKKHTRKITWHFRVRSLGQALWELRLRVDFVHSPGEGVYLQSWLPQVPRGTLVGTCHVSLFCYLLYQLNTFLWTLVPVLVWEPWGLCACVFHVYSSFLLHNCFD